MRKFSAAFSCFSLRFSFGLTRVHSLTHSLSLPFAGECIQKSKYESTDVFASAAQPHAINVFTFRLSCAQRQSSVFHFFLSVFALDFASELRNIYREKVQMVHSVLCRVDARRQRTNDDAFVSIDKSIQYVCARRHVWCTMNGMRTMRLKWKLERLVLWPRVHNRSAALCDFLFRAKCKTLNQRDSVCVAGCAKSRLLFARCERECDWMRLNCVATARPPMQSRW